MATNHSWERPVASLLPIDGLLCARALAMANMQFSMIGDDFGPLFHYQASDKRIGPMPRQRANRGNPPNAPPPVDPPNQVEVNAGSVIRSEFFSIMWLPLLVFLFFKTPVVYVIYGIHVLALVPLLIHMAMKKSTEWFEMFDKHMVYPMVVVQVIPGLLDCYLTYFKQQPDVKVLPILEAATAWEDVMISVALITTLCMYLHYISGRNQPMVEMFGIGSGVWAVLTTVQLIVYVAQEHIAIMPVCAKAAALVALVYCAIHLYIVPQLPEERNKLFVSFLVFAGIAVISVQMMILYDIAAKDSIVKILHLCNFTLGIVLVVGPAVEIALRKIGWRQ